MMWMKRNRRKRKQRKHNCISAQLERTLEVPNTHAKTERMRERKRERQRNRKERVRRKGSGREKSRRN